MIWSERNIARALATDFFNRKYLVVCPNCNWTGHECDLLCVTENLRLIDVEIKISRSDLKADAKKDKWWHRQFAGYGLEEPTRHGSRRPALWNNTARQWQPKVWKHYYAVPDEIWQDDLIDCLPSKQSGVILLRWSDYWQRVVPVCHRKATPNKDAKPVDAAVAVNIARLASLRMWDAHHEVIQCRMEIDRLRAENDNAARQEGAA